MWSRVASFILRNRLFILAIIAIITVFFGYYAATALKVDNRVGNTLPKDDPIQMDYEKFKLQFGEDGSTLVVAVQTDSLYTESNFKKWRELGYKILKIKGVDNVVSEATLFGMTNNIKKNEFEIHRIFSDTTFRDKSIEEVRAEIRKNPIYRGGFVEFKSMSFAFEVFEVEFREFTTHVQHRFINHNFIDTAVPAIWVHTGLHIEFAR